MTGEPATAAEAIEQAEREKEQFLSLVAHELKTPLTPLKSIAQLIRLRLRRARSGERELDLDALDRNLATIERQVDRMDRMVTDLLEVSRFGRGRFELRRSPMDLVVPVRDAVQRWREATAEEGRHEILLDAPSSLPINADRERVEQVIANLLNNAVKYSPSGGEIKVSVEAYPDRAVVTVRDHGVGIPAEEIDTVGREPFTRGKHVETYAGLGVGLYLCRVIAEAHGGRLDITSPGEGKGTGVSLVLPA